jgi:hypothetical protein
VKKRPKRRYRPHDDAGGGSAGARYLPKNRRAPSPSGNDARLLLGEILPLTQRIDLRMI